METNSFDTLGLVQPLAKTVDDPRPLPVRVYEALLERIVNGAFKPDTQLVQEQLAELLGVSRTPVRDALSRLTLEGLVTWIPGTGYLVNKLSDQSIQEIYEVRRPLETLAIRMAAGKHSNQQIAQLQLLVDCMPEGVGADGRGWFELNRDFHLAMIEPCGNQYLLDVLMTLWNNPVNRLITKQYARDREHIDQMIIEHRILVEAAKDKDTDRLIHLIEAHLELGYSETYDSILNAEYPPNPRYGPPRLNN